MLSPRVWSLTVVCLLILVGCASRGPFVWVNDLPTAPAAPVNAAVQPRDTLLIVVAGQPSLTGEFVVRDDGAIVAPLIGKVPLNGLTTDRAATTLALAWKRMVVDPEVSVTITKAASPRVNVVGEVKTPGIFELTRDHSVLGALAAAGWVTEFAEGEGIYVIRRAQGSARVRFRLADIKSASAKTAAFRLIDGDSVVVE